VRNQDKRDALTAVRRLGPEATEAVVDVLCEAFRGYPVMDYVLGPSSERLEHSHRQIVRFFVRVRHLRDEPVLGICEGESPVAVALVSLPADHTYPPAVSVLREELWEEVGSDARLRYEAFGRTVAQFVPDVPHYYLNMIGVRDSHRGLGLAQRILDHLHELSRSDGASAGVTLSTEVRENVPLYERFGYRKVGRATVAGDLETWVLFRPDDPA
jgi:GNAT superfamily N-acetyltransferase